jgi:hypothetical protein
MRRKRTGPDDRTRAAEQRLRQELLTIRGLLMNASLTAVQAEDPCADELAALWHRFRELRPTKWSDIQQGPWSVTAIDYRDGKRVPLGECEDYEAAVALWECSRYCGFPSAGVLIEVVKDQIFVYT